MRINSHEYVLIKYIRTINIGFTVDLLQLEVQVEETIIAQISKTFWLFVFYTCSNSEYQVCVFGHRFDKLNCKLQTLRTWWQH